MGTGGKGIIVLGDTSSVVRDSRYLIGRYKGEEDLKDVFIVKYPKRRTKGLLKFTLVSGHDEDAWYLISFDIKEVIGKRTGMRRKATKEYSIIKEAMLWNLCGWVDNSTYICPEDFSDIPRFYTDHVKVWQVKPYDGETLEAMRGAVAKALAYVKMMLLMQSKRLKGKGIDKAERMLSKLDLLLKMPWYGKVKKLLGIEEIRWDEAEKLRKALEEAKERRKARRTHRARSPRKIALSPQH